MHFHPLSQIRRMLRLLSTARSANLHQSSAQYLQLHTNLIHQKTRKLLQRHIQMHAQPNAKHLICVHTPIARGAATPIARIRSAERQRRLKSRVHTTSRRRYVAHRVVVDH